jgi:superfamily II DNA or RNA helicase
MYELFKKNGIKCERSYGTLPVDHNNKVLKQLENKEIKILFVVDMYNEGTDIKNLSGGMFMRPIYSYSLWQQQLGRLIRKKLDRKTAIVLDFVNNQKNINKIYKTVIQQHAPEKTKYQGGNIIYDIKSLGKITFKKEVVNAIKVMNKRDKLNINVEDMSVEEAKILRVKVQKVLKKKREKIKSKK